MRRALDINDVQQSMPDAESYSGCLTSLSSEIEGNDQKDDNTSSDKNKRSANAQRNRYSSQQLYRY